jgi:hypothetical protein
LRPSTLLALVGIAALLVPLSALSQPADSTSAVAVMIGSEREREREFEGRRRDESQGAVWGAQCEDLKLSREKVLVKIFNPLLRL